MQKKLVVALLICALFSQCARRGSPTGGPKDETPPVMLRAEPPQKTVNFKEDRIRIYFDEYIKLNKLRDQLVVSPPLDQSAYIISPQSLAAKYIEIEFMDTLSPLTTYTFNFGESIVDNNEGNPISFFSYVFSTGETIDSLSLRGTINDALSRTPESFVSVMLYPADRTYNDSVIFNNKPLYYTNTLDSLREFKLENLKEGAYKLIAVKDVSKNYVFDPSEDKIDAISNMITLPNDSLFGLSLYKEVPKFNFGRAYQAGKNRIGFGYIGTGDIEIVLETPVSDSFASTITYDTKKDTIYYWYKGIETDSLIFTLNRDTITKSYDYRLRKAPKDSLSVSFDPKGTLNLSDTLKISTNTPIKEYNKDVISIIDKDSMMVPFNIVRENKNQLQLLFDVFPSDNYIIDFLPGAITDFFDVSNDSMSIKLNTRSRVDYGNLSLRIANSPSSPFFIDLLNQKEIIVRSLYVSEPRGLYRFENIVPNKYFIRIRVDKNFNGIWDTGDFLNKKRPEPVFHFPTILDVRANWELQELINLEKNIVNKTEDSLEKNLIPIR